MHVDRVHHEDVRNQVAFAPEDQAELSYAGQQAGGHRAAIRLHHYASHDQQRVLEPLRAVPRRPRTEVFHHRSREGQLDCRAELVVEVWSETEPKLLGGGHTELYPQQDFTHA